LQKLIRDVKANGFSRLQVESQKELSRFYRQVGRIDTPEDLVG
jgi:hypothetical protein